MKRLIALAGLAFALASCAPSADSPQSATERAPAPTLPQAQTLPVVQLPASRDRIPHAQLPETVIPTAYRLDMVIDPKADGMSGRVGIDAELAPDADGFWMHARDMVIDRATISLGDETLMIEPEMIDLSVAPSGLVWMQLPQSHPGGVVTIGLDYSTPYNLNLNSAYKVERGEDAYIVTQMEPLGAREAFPSFDEPKYKQPFTLSITAPVDDVVVSNTPVVSVEPAGEGMQTHQFAQTLPLPTYLIAFAVGPYDVVDFGDLPPNDVRDRPLALRGIAARGEGPRLQYALENTDGLLSALERYFGLEYPYEKLDLLAAPDYAFGAMENPGLIVYREYLLLLDDTAPLSQKRAHARVHSHELAHQWFGNLVTPVWWEDIWLNEAFATWMGNKGLRLWQPEGGFDNVTLNASLGAMNTDSLASTRRVREPLLRSENVMDQFDSITYRKGGGVLDMFESFVGEEAFQAGVRLHMERYRHDVATADDFFESIADGSGNPNVASAMQSFVDQPGLPLVRVRAGCVDEQMGLSLSQSRYSPLGSYVSQGQFWEIPVCVRADTLDDPYCRLIGTEGTERTFLDVIENAECPAFIMPNADGAGYYRFTLDADGWAALMANLDQLNTREVLSAQDSLIAAFRAGDVNGETFLSGMRAFAAHPDYEVAGSSTQLLSFIHREFPDLRPGLARHISRAYGARYRANRGDDTPEGNLLAPQLGSLLATLGNDQEARNYLIRQGTLYLGLGVLEQDEEKRAQVPSNILGSAFSQLMRSQSAAAFDPLLDLAANGSPLEKSAALAALTRTPDADQATRLLEIALAEDSPLTGRQTNTILSGLMANEAHADRTWDWFKTNFDDYMIRKVPDVRRGRAPTFADGFCSLERRDKVDAFFTQKAAIIPGYERSLAQTLERIELCAALKEAQGPSLADALGG